MKYAIKKERWLAIDKEQVIDSDEDLTLLMARNKEKLKLRFVRA